jgi:hypothetical protein
MASAGFGSTPDAAELSSGVRAVAPHSSVYTPDSADAGSETPESARKSRPRDGIARALKQVQSSAKEERTQCEY